MTVPTRPVLRYHGGKWRLAPWILSFLPVHRTYVEPYGGAASVLLRKPRSYAEVYNDLDGEVVNVFRVLRDPALASELERLLRLTPFARVEFEAAYDAHTDRVEQARRTIVKAFMGFSSGAHHDERPRGMRTSSSLWKPPTGFRPNTTRSGTTPASDWASYPDQIVAFVERLSGVVVENRPAIDVMRTHDRAEALHYVDPPYVSSTRNMRRRTDVYRHEMADAEHIELAAILHALVGMVVVSGYPSPLYDELYRGWERHERLALADRAKPRTEVVWLNQTCSAALEASRGQLQLGEASA